MTIFQTLCIITQCSQLKATLHQLSRELLDVALEYNDLQAALNIATHWVAQEPKDVPALFICHILL